METDPPLCWLPNEKVESSLYVLRRTHHQISYQKRKEYDKKIRKIEKQIFNIENEISSLEDKKKELDLQLSDPIKFKELTKSPDFYVNYDLDQKNLSKKEDEWGSLVAKLNALKNENNQ